MKHLMKVLMIVAMAMVCSSCKVVAEVVHEIEKVPYQISAQMVMDESALYENAGLEFSFLNKSEKAVASFTMVFYLFDDDGEPPSGAKSNIVLTVNASVCGNEKIEDCTSLDKYIYVLPDFPFSVDYLYVSKIVYEDGTVWSDPLGFLVF